MLNYIPALVLLLCACCTADLKLRFLNALPDAGNADVYVGDQIVFKNVPYKTVTDFVVLPQSYMTEVMSPDGPTELLYFVYLYHTGTVQTLFYPDLIAGYYVPYEDDAKAATIVAGGSCANKTCYPFWFWEQSMQPYGNNTQYRFINVANTLYTTYDIDQTTVQSIQLSNLGGGSSTPYLLSNSPIVDGIFEVRIHSSQLLVLNISHVEFPAGTAHSVYLYNGPQLELESWIVADNVNPASTTNDSDSSDDLTIWYALFPVGIVLGVVVGGVATFLFTRRHYGYSRINS